MFKREFLRLWLWVGVLMVACQSAAASGDPERGAELFITLPCAGCHGVTAQGQFGPALAGTSLTFEEVRRQVRNPRDKMVPFSPDQVSDKDLQDIYAWLTSLPRPQPTGRVFVPAATATIQSRNRLFPEMDATMIVARLEHLDEVALRIQGEIISVQEGDRYSEVQIQMDDGVTKVTVIGIYDTAIARQTFPAEPGSSVILYGVGTDPVDTVDSQIPRLQIIYVVP